MVSRQILLNYTNAINTISTSAQTEIGNALVHLDVSDIATARNVVIGVMNRCLGTYTDAVATLASAFYDAARTSELGKPVDALAESGRNPDATEGAVRAFMQIVVDGGTHEQLIASLKDRADYEIKVAAGKAVVYCGERDPLD